MTLENCSDGGSETTTSEKLAVSVGTGIDCRSVPVAARGSSPGDRKQRHSTIVSRYRRAKLVTCLLAALSLGAACGAGPACAASSSLVTFGWQAFSPAGQSFATPFSASGVIRNVNSCLDDGSVGTLRQVVGASGTGDTIDLGGLPLSCSTITLAMGEILVPQSDLTITGPVARTLTIANSQISRILHHSGLGELSVEHLTLSSGSFYSPAGPAKGGCILSAGYVHLNASTVSGCKAFTYSGSAAGGAIYAANKIVLNSSRVTDSAAYSYAASKAYGGGVYVHSGVLFTTYSGLSRNSCSTAPGGYASGGGAWVRGSVTLIDSLIDFNESSYGGGGITWFGTGTTLAIENSTISGNRAAVAGGGAEANSQGLNPSTVSILGSTIAFNAAARSAGVNSYSSVYMLSSIIAKNSNTSPGGFADLYIKGSGQSLTGHNNLIIASNLALAGTIGGDPKLTPLVDHGGPTRTHGLSLGSPVLDHGINPLGSTNDQRGFGFARVVNGAADIGAYERQLNDDELFYGGFD